MDTTSSIPTGETILQPFSAGDAPILKAFARPIWEEAYASIISDEQIEFMLEKNYEPETLRHEIVEASVEYRWIVSDTARAGFLASEISPDHSAFLHKFYLLPTFWGQGIAGSAMELLAEILSQRGVDTLQLRVNRENQRAIQFYQKCGFLKTGEDCLPIGNGFVMDDYLMSLSLH